MIEDLSHLAKSGPAVGGSVPHGLGCAVRGHRIAPLLREFFGARAGVVSIELALVAIVLVVLAFGAFDFARYGIETTRIVNAARAGAQYGIQDEESAADAAAIELAVRSDAEDTNNELTVTVEEPFCLCPINIAKDCSANCADGNYAPMYVEVTVEGQMDFLFDLPGMPDAAAITGFSRMRVK